MMEEEEIGGPEKGKGHVQIKSKEQIIINKTKFQCSSMKFMLMDDTGLVEYPVVLFKVDQLAFNRNLYLDVDDAATYILKRMGIYQKMKEESKKEEDPYNVTSASLTMELTCFNNNVQAYEPMIEPWSLTYSEY